MSNKLDTNKFEDISSGKALLGYYLDKTVFDMNAKERALQSSVNNKLRRDESKIQIKEFRDFTIENILSQIDNDYHKCLSKYKKDG